MTKAIWEDPRLPGIARAYQAVEWIQKDGAMLLDADGLPLPGEAEEGRETRRDGPGSPGPFSHSRPTWL